MPYVRVLWKPSEFGEVDLVRLRDSLPNVVGNALEGSDPDHTVTEEMVDVRIEPVGPLDLLHPAMLITVFARHETARHDARDRILEQITRAIEAVGCPPNTMIELVLTVRTSVYEYRGDR